MKWEKDLVFFTQTDPSGDEEGAVQRKLQMYQKHNPSSVPIAATHSQTHSPNTDGSGKVNPVRQRPLWRTLKKENGRVTLYI